MDTHLFLQLQILLLCVDKVQHNIESPGENERKEETEPREVRVPLRTIQGTTLACAYIRRNQSDALEFTCGEIALGAHIMNRLGCIRFCGFCFRTYAEHSCHCVHEKDGDKSCNASSDMIRRSKNNVLHEGNFNAIGNLRHDIAFRQECEHLLANGVRERRHDYAECCHLVSYVSGRARCCSLHDPDLCCE